MKSYYQVAKIVTYGYYFDVYEYQIPICKKSTIPLRQGRAIIESMLSQGKNPDKKPKTKMGESKNLITNRIISANRAKTRVRRLILGNFKKNHYYITLTYKQNVLDLNIANRDFQDWIREMKRLGMIPHETKWLAVPERQQRGAIHYHMVLNRKPYRIKKVEVFYIWKHGAVKVFKIYNEIKLAFYLAKYMTKQIGELTEVGKKTYLCSKGLTRPHENAILGTDGHRLQVSFEDAELLRKKSYRSKINGTVNYRQYKQEEFNF